MFEKYQELIKELNNFNKEDIIIKDFLLYKEKNMEIYYAPHNETINKGAKVLIVGITPGWTQTSIAYKTANAGLKKNLNIEEIKKECKRNSRFAGTMRVNLIKMLDELKLHEKLNIESCELLFNRKEELLHTTSIIPYPVFINNKNYTGSNPNMLENKKLLNYINKNFSYELQNNKDAFIIPLGKAVEEVLEYMIKKGLINEEQCLFGFPHPSGANGHRIKQFEQNKNMLQDQINLFFDVKE